MAFYWTGDTDPYTYHLRAYLDNSNYYFKLEKMAHDCQSQGMSKADAISLMAAALRSDVEKEFARAYKPGVSGMIDSFYPTLADLKIDYDGIVKTFIGYAYDDDASANRKPKTSKNVRPKGKPPAVPTASKRKPAARKSGSRKPATKSGRK